MLRFKEEDPGFCRVMFTRYTNGMKVLYCWQQARTEGEFEFYRCTLEGEPDYIVQGWGGQSAKERTPQNPGETEIGRALNAYLEKLK